ncbi:hypothetical protein ABW20_dc0110090 [Dactylellina cionopaga]|nr:hypothetical protein ABW20_dc0110090 [Dactylellina cionopaga]
MISVCKPDWAKVAQIVKSTRTGPDGILAWNPLVTSDICTTTDHDKLSEAFRSYPSGHATMAFAGLTYLSLFFYSTLVLTLTKTSMTKLPFSVFGHHKHKRSDSEEKATALRVSKLHPPSLPLLTFAIVISFFCLAMWIGATRYLDFKHAGIDIFSGSLLGFFSAICSTWWYAMPAAGGVAKGRMRAGYREYKRQSNSAADDTDEPRGPIAAGERLLPQRHSMEEAGSHEPKYEPSGSRGAGF